uniref:Uncharacterized protein n=1 Tax=Catharus ustulatus TaxID=91951 RepID=A0A8C3ULI2_CATUS
MPWGQSQPRPSARAGRLSSLSSEPWLCPTTDASPAAPAVPSALCGVVFCQLNKDFSAVLGEALAAPRCEDEIGTQCVGMPAPNPAWLWDAAAPGDPRQDISAGFVPLQQCSTPSSNMWKVIFFSLPNLFTLGKDPFLAFLWSSGG